MSELPGLSPDWHPPLRDLAANAWSDLSEPERERLEALWQERDANGERIWKQVLDDDPDDPTWQVLALRPVDTDDLRSERVGRWPKKVEAEPLKDAQAIVDEHDPD